MKVTTYEAVASVKVDHKKPIMVMNLKSITEGTSEEMKTQCMVMTSFPVIFRAAKKLSLLSDTLTEESAFYNEDILKKFELISGRIKVDVESKTDILNVTVTHTSPEDARDLANAVVFAYKDFSYHTKKLESMSTREFLEQQLSKHHNDLRESEVEIKSFKESQKLPDIQKDTDRILGKAISLEKRLESIRTTIDELTFARKRFISYSRKNAEVAGTVQAVSGALPAGFKTDSTLEYVDTDALNQLTNRLYNLQLTLSEQLGYYKSSHPSIRELNNRIKETAQRIVSEYTQKINDLQEKRKRLIEEEVDNQQELLRIPANQMRYSQLVLKQNVNQELYTMLTKNLQEAKIAEAGVVEDVTIMALATLPESPSNKNSFNVIFCGFLLGCVLGILISIIREMFDTSIGTIEEVEHAMKMPVLAAVPHIQVENNQKNHKMRRRPNGRKPVSETRNAA